jgi:phage FluMu protein Com
LDGNASAGPLAAAFGVDMTAVPGRCAHCGAVHMVAELRAYMRAHGTVLRCPVCDGVVLRIVETDEATYVDTRGGSVPALRTQMVLLRRATTDRPT